MKGGSIETWEYGRLSVIGWKLEPACREFLLEIFPPRWPDMIADHVTLDADAASDSPLPQETEASVIGHADDEDGLEALVVEIGGTADRPDGSIFHITWSLDRNRGRAARESNILLRKGWKALGAPIAIRLDPARLK